MPGLEVGWPAESGSVIAPAMIRPNKVLAGLAPFPMANTRSCPEGKQV